jgi:dehydrogenase/reductase SDR family protein 7B
MHFKDKIFWITGASSGIGKELAIQLAKKGGKLILTSSNLDSLKLVQEELNTYSDSVNLLPFDLLSLEKIPNLVQAAMAVHGSIDFVIQSAGISQRSLAENTDLQVYKKIMDLNYFAPVAITQEIMPFFKSKNSGGMIVISSIAGLIGFPLRSGYAASKHAIKAYIETLQSENYESKIYISSVFPGRINTNISRNALLGNGEKSGKQDANNKVGMDVAKCASLILKGIEKRKRNIIIGFPERFLLWVWWFIPSLYYKIAFKKGVENN